MNKISNTQTDNANNIDVLMSMFNLLVYSNRMFLQLFRNIWMFMAI